jgi:hypothetical protein
MIEDAANNIDFDIPMSHLASGYPIAKPPCPRR